MNERELCAVFSFLNLFHVVFGNFVKLIVFPWVFMSRDNVTLNCTYLYLYLFYYFVFHRFDFY